MKVVKIFLSSVFCPLITDPHKQKVTEKISGICCYFEIDIVPMSKFQSSAFCPQATDPQRNEQTPSNATVKAS